MSRRVIGKIYYGLGKVDFFGKSRCEVGRREGGS